MLKKLVSVQTKLKAPKSNYNSFGKYKYRSCEDILEAVKPLLQAEGCTLHISDEVVLIGDRYYIKATATFIDCETAASVSVSALARESEDKKGQDSSQVTGTASSYARKYALNGLFLIDDTKDADTDEYAKAGFIDHDKPAYATELQKKTFLDRCKALNVDYKVILKQAGVTGQMTGSQLAQCLIILNEIERGK